MIDLSPDTEALASRLAEAQGLTVEETVRQALRVCEQNVQVKQPTVDPSPDVVAARYAAIERAVQAVAALPDLDSRSSREIMDDLDPL